MIRSCSLWYSCSIYLGMAGPFDRCLTWATMTNEVSFFRSTSTLSPPINAVSYTPNAFYPCPDLSPKLAFTSTLSCFDIRSTHAKYSGTCRYIDIRASVCANAINTSTSDASAANHSAPSWTTPVYTWIPRFCSTQRYTLSGCCEGLVFAKRTAARSAGRCFEFKGYYRKTAFTQVTLRNALHSHLAVLLDSEWRDDLLDNHLIQKIV
jgi:hypothetical protein